ncbi:MAG: hypothetical protein ACREQM_02160 [Candidatus Dormibacteraceae bacterium]
MLTIARFRVFEREGAGGNPCPIVVDATRLSAAEMRRTAAHSSVLNPKRLVPLRAASEVHRTSPDFDLLWKLCGELEATGAYVSSPHRQQAR